MTSADCSENVSITVDPIIKEAQVEYLSEKNLKNSMYKFIIEHGLFRMLLEYIEVNGIQIPDGRIHELPGVVRRIYLKPEWKEKKKKKHKYSKL